MKIICKCRFSNRSNVETWWFKLRENAKNYGFFVHLAKLQSIGKCCNYAAALQSCKSLAKQSYKIE